MKRAFIIVILLWSVSALFGLDVSRAELATTSERYIRFVNYEGPRSKIESAEEIRGIGVYLARTMTGGTGPFRYYGRYAVIHAVDPDRPDALSADIFMVLPESQIDHIDNLRLMVAGFLQESYGYNLPDALLLADFITLYNAVHRRDLDYFRGRYIPNVIGYLNEEQAGLSNLYSDWPGGTQMLIPLSSAAGQGRLSSLDGQELTDDAVTEQLRTQPDRGVAERKEMVELQERGLDQEASRLAQERAAVQSERRQIEAERTAVEQERTAAETQQEELARVDMTPEDRQETGQLIERQEQALDRRETAVAQQEQDVARREDRIVSREQDIQERRDAVREDREVIAQDQQAVIDEQQQIAAAAAVRPAGAPPELYFLEVIEGLDEPLARILAINAGDGSRLRASKLNTIRGRQYQALGNRIVVLAGRTGGAGAVRLVLLEERNLEVVKEGREDIFQASVVEVRNEEVYAVMEKNGAWHLARFDRDLNLLASSDVGLNPYSTLVFGGETIFVQARDGSISRLSVRDLRRTDS